MSARTAGSKALSLGGVPRVDLLPPEFEQSRKSKVLIKRLLLGLAATLALVLVAVGVGVVQLIVTGVGLANENTRAETLAAEQEKYAVVTTINSQASKIEAIQPEATAGEVLWEPYLALVAGTLPVDTSITAFTAELKDSAAAPTPEAVLQAPHIAMLQLTADSPQASVSDWLENMSKLTGYVDATPQSVVLVSETGRYTVQVNLLINKDAISNRFTVEKTP
ncbi:MAG: hypothetical protein ACRCSP_03360 [Rhodoglobus sp.]